MFFYVDTENPGSHRYDLSRFMDYSEGVHDEFTSYMLTQIRRLPVRGQYRISVPARPDIYSRDIYQSTRHWMLLLVYNDVALLESLRAGSILLYPDLNQVENIYFSLGALTSSGTPVS